MFVFCILKLNFHIRSQFLAMRIRANKINQQRFVHIGYSDRKQTFAEHRAKLNNRLLLSYSCRVEQPSCELLIYVANINYPFRGECERPKCYWREIMIEKP